MKVIPAHFDGSKIAIPDELRARGPGEILLLVKDPGSDKHSWRDVVGTLKNAPPIAELDRWLNEVRGEWGTE
jgi:hypothetical protein